LRGSDVATYYQNGLQMHGSRDQMLKSGCQFYMNNVGMAHSTLGKIFEKPMLRFHSETDWRPTLRSALIVMAKLLFLPIAKQIESGTYLLCAIARSKVGSMAVAEQK
jgi:hypothetical protein